MIQHILEIQKGKNCENIFSALNGKVYEMSIHKFASNVIERCLHFGSKIEKNQLIDEVLEKNEKMYNSIISLVKDKFGNYVVQKMMEYSDEEKRKQIIKKILGSKILQKNDGYTKHVLLYIQKLGYNIQEENSENSENSNDNVNNVNNNEIVKKENKSNNSNNIINDNNKDLKLKNLHLNNLNSNNINLNSGKESTFYKEQEKKI